MSGLTDLRVLLANALPTLAEGEWVFVSVTDPATTAKLKALCTFRETEGVSVICRKEDGETAGLPYDGTYRQITLAIQSSLQAVGFLAAVATALARAGIPCNAVAAFHHDHLFVPAERAAEAVGLLRTLNP